ncbi:Protein pelota [Gossypium arboreum]|uniref:Protein pelota n=1 Tax=Gossypium arboreum TaxID=29729 RepID=A0A0B0MYC8_GOSAR|nr:Protein pelota [Gossypium arboreum]
MMDFLICIFAKPKKIEYGGQISVVQALLEELPVIAKLVFVSCASLHASVEEQITALKIELLQEVHGSKAKETSWNYANEPLALEVLTHNILASFKLPKLVYNGTSDLEDHLAHYHHHMNILVFLKPIMYNIALKKASPVMASKTSL